MKNNAATATHALLLLIALSTAPVGAQDAAQGEAAAAEEAWHGPVSLGIQVTDERGQALPGAIVALRYAGDTKSAGPPLLQTDEEGRAELASIAAGDWQADIRRDGYMLYTAYLHLEPGETPELGFRTRQRTGSFWAALEVRFYDPDRVAAVGGGRVLSPQQEKKEERRIAKQEKRQRKREEAPDVAVVVEESPFEAAAETPSESASAPAPPGPASSAQTAPPGRPTAPPASEEKTELPPSEAGVGEEGTPRSASPSAVGSVEPPSAPSLPAPAAEPGAGEAELPAEEWAPATVAAVEPAAERPSSPPGPEAAAVAEAPPPAAGASTLSEAAPAPEPPPAPAPVAAPADRPIATPPPAPPPLRLPTIRPNPNLLPAGACPECRAGEWSVAADGVAAPRRVAVSCETTFDDRLAQASALVAETLPAELRDFAGSLLDARGGDDVLRLMPSDAGRRITELLEVEESGGCQVVGVVLPRGARYVGFRYQAADTGSGLGECPPDGDCQIGEARWLGNPVLQRSPEMTVVYALFENRSAERERRPRLVVYFRPRSGWSPPTR